MSDSKHSELPEDALPQEVVAKLREPSAKKHVVPNYVDEAILADARAVLAAGKPSRSRFGNRKWTLGLVSVGSLAAALLVAVWPQVNSPDQRAGDASALVQNSPAEAAMAGDEALSDSMPAWRREDIDRDGRVDILDAFALARQVSLSGSGATDGDQNDDGIVDDSDINLVALTAVTL